ncbi:MULTISPECIES: hypothetical protein [Alteribacter]|nr:MULTISPECIES: hypothetical protein [Alteribacter]
MKRMLMAGAGIGASFYVFGLIKDFLEGKYIEKQRELKKEGRR